jgi:phage-related minor tail protein
MNVGRDATRGFIDDLLSGATAGEAFANVLKKISSQLLDLAMNDLFGKGGGLGGLFGSLFGGGGGGFPGGGSLNSFGGLYADGGYTGSGGKNDPAGIVHKGEVVWSQDDIRKAGGLASVEGMRSRGGAMPQMPKLVMGGGGGGNVTAPVNIQIDARGADREGLARLEGQLARLRSEIPARVVTAVRDANKTNVKFR